MRENIKISLEGVEIAIPRQKSLSLVIKEQIQVNLFGETISAQVAEKIEHQKANIESIVVNFEQLELSTERKLVAELYCRPGRWAERKSPGELKSLLLMLRALMAKFFLIGKRGLFEL